MTSRSPDAVEKIATSQTLSTAKDGEPLLTSTHQIGLGPRTVTARHWVATKLIQLVDNAPAEIVLSIGLLALPPPPKRHGSGRAAQINKQSDAKHNL